MLGTIRKIIPANAAGFLTEGKKAAAFAVLVRAFLLAKSGQHQRLRLIAERAAPGSHMPWRCVSAGLSLPRSEGSRSAAVVHVRESCTGSPWCRRLRRPQRLA
jgi:hypothetical protein